MKKITRLKTPMKVIKENEFYFYNKPKNNGVKVKFQKARHSDYGESIKIAKIGIDSSH